LNFIFGIVCLFVCVCAFSLRRESPDMILGDKTPHFWGGSVTLGVTSVEDKLVQHCLRWFEHMQRRPTEAPIRNRVIRWIGNKKRGRRRPNLTWEEHVKKVLNDWCITKELTLDRREQKLAIHVSESWSSVPSFYCLLSSFFSCPFFTFLT
jgi:hypothetical protein